MSISAVDHVGLDFVNGMYDDDDEKEIQQAVANVAGAIVNIGWLVVNLQRSVEDKHDIKIGNKLAEIDELHDQIEAITTFLERLEEKLGVENDDPIDFSEHQKLLDDLNELFPHALLDKAQWTRAEGDALSKAYSRRIEQVSRLINPKMVDVNHLMEDRHEMLQLVREILKMWREMLQGMTRAQKAQ